MIDYSSVSSDMAVAVTDIVAGCLILVGAYAGFWGFRKVLQLFKEEEDNSWLLD